MTPFLVLAASAAALAGGNLPSASQIAERIATMRIISPCIVERDHKAAVRYVLADSQTETNVAWQRLRAPFAACVRHYAIRLQPIELRGALAEDLLKSHNMQLLTRAASLASVMPVRMTAVTNLTYPTNLVSCAAAAQPAKAVDLLIASSGMTEEMRRVDAFQPALAACMPASQRVAVSAPVLRTLVATVLFHRVTSEGIMP